MEDEEILGARYALVKAVEDGKHEFTGYDLSEFDELIEVHAVGILGKYLINHKICLPRVEELALDDFGLADVGL